MYKLTNQQKGEIYFNTSNLGKICNYLNGMDKAQNMEFLEPLFLEIRSEVLLYNMHLNYIDIISSSIFKADKKSEDFKIYLAYEGIKVHLTLNRVDVIKF